MADAVPVRKPAFGASFSSQTTDDLRAMERADVNVISVHASAGHTAAKAALALLGLDAPAHGGFTGDDRLGVIAVGPGAWLVLRSPADPLWAEHLRRELATTCAIADQSGSYAVARIEGPRATALLAKGAYLDFHPAAFPAGHAAVTVCGHIPAIIWRPSEALTYDVAVFRSYARSFAHWLGESVRLGFPGT